MSLVIRLGFKNIFRQPLRTALALLGIAVAVAGVLVGTSLMNGIEAMIFDEAVAELGEIVVARQDYFERSRFNPLKHALRDSTALRARLLETPGVRLAIERIDFGFVAERDERSTALGCIGVNVEAFAERSKLPARLVAGRFVQPGEKALVLGSWAAEQLEVGPGDQLTLLGRTRYDSFTADDFTVVGVYDMGSKLANRGSLMPLAAAQEFLEMEDAVSRILLFTEDYRDAEAIAGALADGGALPDGVVPRPWTQDFLLGTVDRALNVAGLILSAIICSVAGLGIFNMMMVAVLERRKEMGVLNALGMQRLSIIGCYLTEAVVYGLAGGVAGVFLGAPLALYLDRVGISFRADDIQGLPMAIGNSLHAEFGPESVLWGLVMGVALSVFGTLIPVLKTSSMGPQDAMTR